MFSFIKKTTVTLVAGSLFLASSALALEPKSSKPTIIKPDWHYDKYVKETTNDLLKPQKIEYMPVSVKEQVYYEVSNKFEVVPMQYEHATYEKYDPDADYVDENEYSSEPELNSSSDESESSSNSEGDAITDDGSDAEPSISDGSLKEETISIIEGIKTPDTSGLKLPEFDSIFDYGKNLGEKEETATADYSNTEEAAELDAVTTTIKIKIVLEDTEYEDGSMNATLLKDGIAILDSGSVTFKPSETVANKGTLVVEFDNTENLSHNDFDSLNITSTTSYSLVSYAISINKKITAEGQVLTPTGEAGALLLSFLTDDSEISPSSTPSYTTSIKIKNVLQYTEGEKYVEGTLDSAPYGADGALAELGTGEISFTESSTVEGKGTLSVYYGLTGDIGFHDITQVVNKTNGTVSAELLNYSVEIEKKVKPTDTTFTPTEESSTLSLPVF